MNLTQAKAIIGTDIGVPSKMPGYSFGLPARACITGARMVAAVKTGSIAPKTSICGSCYAMRGNYTIPNIQKGLYRRLAALRIALDGSAAHREAWVSAMVYLISTARIKPRGIRRKWDARSKTQKEMKGERARRDSKYFRWHDSGDLQSVEHLELIAQVARRLPKVRFWLATREYKMFENWYATLTNRPTPAFPKNLVIRLSAHLFGNALPIALAKKYGVQASGAHRKRGEQPGKGVFVCPAHQQNNNCGSCRMCWNPKRIAVSYQAH